MQLGFSVLASALNCVVAGVGAQAEPILPEMFDPTARSKSRTAKSGDVVRCGPNQMRNLVIGMVGNVW